MSPLGDCRAGRVGGVNLFAQMLVIWLSINHQGKKHFVSLIAKISLHTDNRAVKITQIIKGKEAPPRLHTWKPKVGATCPGSVCPTPHLRSPFQPQVFLPCLTRAAHSNNTKSITERGDLTCEANHSSSWEPQQILSIAIFNSPPNMVN